MWIQNFQKSIPISAKNIKAFEMILKLKAFYNIPTKIILFMCSVTNSICNTESEEEISLINCFKGTTLDTPNLDLD